MVDEVTAEGPPHEDYLLESYDYELPSSLIAQAPAQRREASRMLMLDRSTGDLEHRSFDDLPAWLRPGDVLVVNDTRVVPARLQASKETGGRVELLVLDPYPEARRGEEEGYWCMVKASKRSRPGTTLTFRDGTRARVLSPLQEGKAFVRFLTAEPLPGLLQRLGEVPLPPYIHRDPGPRPIDDASCYQTVYARNPGAVAAPTAGLHFSEPLLRTLAERKVELVTVTLHVGHGTFAPVRVDDVRLHGMHSEYVEISPESAGRIAEAKREGRRIVAVGTTVVRTLEWVAAQTGAVKDYAGMCSHYIYPGYRFQVIDAMITNFHLPRSTLLLLVSAFAGRGAILGAYEEAVRRRYRFFSYGDAMLIL